MILERCPWLIAGPLLGLVIVGLRAALNKVATMTFVATAVVRARVFVWTFGSGR